MKTLLLAAFLVAVPLSVSHAQAWRPKTTTRRTTVTTTTAPRPTTRIYSYRTMRTHTRVTGVTNARLHGGVAHAYGHTKARRNRGYAHGRREH